MPSYRDRPVDQVRRKDRQLTDAVWIERFLMQAPFGHLAVAHQGQPMIHEILPVGVLQCSCSMFGDETTREALVVDPGDDIEDVQAALARHGLSVKAIVLGNHDWMYHLPGPGMQQIRQKIAAAMHLANPDAFFPHDPAESKVVEALFLQHSVFGRHGDIYDPINYIKEEGRDHASLGDAMVVELFNRIPVRIRSELGNQLPPAFFGDLNEMGSVRPGVMTPVWIASMLDRHRVSPANRKQINEIWKDLVSQFLKLEFLDELDRPFQIDIVDGVKAFLGLLKSVSIEKLDDWTKVVEKGMGLVNFISGGSEYNYDRYAIQEKPYQSKTARFIVYGHTHGYLVYPLRSIQVNEVRLSGATVFTVARNFTTMI